MAKFCTLLRKKSKFLALPCMSNKLFAARTSSVLLGISFCDVLSEFLMIFTEVWMQCLRYGCNYRKSRWVYVGLDRAIRDSIGGRSSEKTTLEPMGVQLQGNGDIKLLWPLWGFKWRLDPPGVRILHAPCWTWFPQATMFFNDAPPCPPVDSRPPPTNGDNPLQKKKTSSSLNQAELAKFPAISETWWDAEGPFKPLHAMNPTRLAFIRSTLCRHFGKDPYCAKPFEGLKFVDVGCGGGILSEPLARMGATVTGIDAVDKNIKIARLHAVEKL